MFKSLFCSVLNQIQAYNMDTIIMKNSKLLGGKFIFTIYNGFFWLKLNTHLNCLFLFLHKYKFHENNNYKWT
jgi:hypothetical protein